jgi:hypothetical protein
MNWNIQMKRHRMLLYMIPTHRAMVRPRTDGAGDVHLQPVGTVQHPTISNVYSNGMLAGSPEPSSGGYHDSSLGPAGSLVPTFESTDPTDEPPPHIRQQL